jgi:hypothetical protein
MMTSEYKEAVMALYKFCFKFALDNDLIGDSFKSLDFETEIFPFNSIEPLMPLFGEIYNHMLKYDDESLES